MHMTITVTPEGEEWRRDFDGHVLSSVVRRIAENQVAERFGIFDVRMRPHASTEGLDMPVIGISILGIPVPNFLVTRSGGTERVTEDGKSGFVSRPRCAGLAFSLLTRVRLHPWPNDVSWSCPA